MNPRDDSAERLPELYRAILDAVVSLEHRGARAEAAVIRRSATRAYRVWDANAQRKLLRLQADAARRLGETGQGRGRRTWSSRFRVVRPPRPGSGNAPGDGLAERAPSA